MLRFAPEQFVSNCCIICRTKTLFIQCTVFARERNKETELMFFGPCLLRRFAVERMRLRIGFSLIVLPLGDEDCSNNADDGNSDHWNYYSGCNDTNILTLGSKNGRNISIIFQKSANICIPLLLGMDEALFCELRPV